MIARTKTMTTTKKVNSSVRVGLTTFFSSAITCRTNRAILANSPRFLAVPGVPEPRPARSGLPGVALADSLTGGLPHSSRYLGRDVSVTALLQGRWDSNPQPPVLETGALPIAPLPFTQLPRAGGAATLRTRAVGAHGRARRQKPPGIECTRPRHAGRTRCRVIRIAGGRRRPLAPHSGRTSLARPAASVTRYPGE